MRPVLRHILMGIRALWSPLSLFAANEPGALYDIADLTDAKLASGLTGAAFLAAYPNTLLYQDSAFTTPVTALEQSVGGVLDKSKGLVLGSDVLNGAGSFTSSAGWSIGAGWTIGSGVATASSAASISYDAVLTIGKTYFVQVDCVSYSAGPFYCGSLGQLKAMVTGAGTSKQCIFTADAVRFNIAGLTGFTGVIDNVTVREIPGNHLIQATSGNRPKVSARVNLLTKTEDFSDAAWTKTNLTIGSNLVVNGQTLTKLVLSASGSTHYAVQSVSTVSKSLFYFYAKAGEYSCAGISANFANYVWFDLTNGAVSTIGSGFQGGGCIPQPNGVYLCYAYSTVTNWATVQIFVSTIFTADGNSNNGTVGDGIKGVYIGQPQLEYGTTATRYQRVNTATDYDYVGFPKYLAFNGTNSCMYTAANMDLSSTDKVSVFAGVQKLSDAGQHIVFETSATIASNNGTLMLSAPNSAAANYNFSSKGTTQQDNTVTTYTSPVTNVVTGLASISGPSNKIRVNGADIATVSASQGTGNFTSQVAYVGARGASSLFFNGNLYELIVRGALTANPQLIQTEDYINSLMGKAYSTDTYIATPAATPAAFGNAFEGGFYAGLIWNELVESTTSVAIATGAQAIVVNSHGPFCYPGQTLEVRSRANPANKMAGTVISFDKSNNTLNLNITSVGGSGTFTDWSVMARYRIIVAPKASGESSSKMYKNANTAAPAACGTLTEGRLATLAMVAAGDATVYPAAWFCTGLNIGGKTDWYLPARDELELAWRNLKPTADANYVIANRPTGATPNYMNLGSYGDTANTHGLNNNSSPTGAAYTAGDPAQVAAGKNFRTGQSEAFAYGSYAYWSASEYSTTTAWLQLWDSALPGYQFNGGKVNAYYVRAVRRSII